MQGFDNQRNSSKGAYLTEKEIKKIINDVFNEKSKFIIGKIFDKLARKSITIFISIIIGGFVVFSALTYFISILDENNKLRTELAICNIENKNLHSTNTSIKK